MRVLIFGCLTVIAFSFAPGKVQAQLDLLDVGRAMDRFADRLEKIVNDAGAKGDLLIERNGRILQGVVRDARIQLEEVLEEKIGELKLEHRNFLATLNTLTEEIGEAKGRILELEDFIALDLENIVGQLPGRAALFGNKLEKLSFRRLDGYSQKFQASGVYTFRFIGAAFGPDYRSVVRVNGVKAKQFDLRTPRAYVLEVDVPAEVLNVRFADNKIARAAVEAESFAEGKEKPAFSYAGDILLLPKFPLTVTLVERRSVQEWSEKSYISEIGSANLPRTNVYPKGSEPSSRGTVIASIPAGCLMLKDQYDFRFEPAGERPWSSWEAPRFSNEDRTISISGKHWLWRTDVVVTLAVPYKKPVTVVKENLIPVGTATGKGNYLPFGTTQVELSPTYQSFTLKAKWFNGREYTLTPLQLAQPGIKALLETSSPPRLLVHVSWPENGTRP